MHHRKHMPRLGPTENTYLHYFFYCCVTSLAHVNVPRVRYITAVRARTTESTAPVLLAACVLWASPSSGSIRHNIKEKVYN
jgi:hypothetical protein